MPVAFTPAGTFGGALGFGVNLQNPTSLQFGPDGRLYVSEQNGDINAFTVEKQGASWVVTDAEMLTLPGGGGVVKSIQNHNDDGTESSNGNRQVTGLVVAGTPDAPVLYVSSSDPRIASNNDSGLDTNSGVVSKVSWNSASQEWEVVDLVRGLPRSEENHSVNGMILTEGGTKLLLQVGGFTNNGAASGFFSYTNEYALSGATLELDLVALDALPDQIDPEGGQGGAPRAYKYDLPTLDDPNITNAPDTLTDAQALAQGFRENSEGMDLDGPHGGNDGLNMAILPSNAPLRLYADGTRNAYDIAQGPNGLIYTVDNGSNGNLGAAPNTESNDDDGDGIPNEAIATPNNGGQGEGEPFHQIVEGGYYYHANPVRSNQNMAWTVYDNNQNPDPSVSVNQVDDISALVPAQLINDGVMTPGYLIDPTKFAVAPGQTLQELIDLDAQDNGTRAQERLFLSGLWINSNELDNIADPDGSGSGQTTIAQLGSSTNGIIVYDSGGAAFGGSIDGAVFVTQFNDNLTLLNVNDAGTDLEPIFEEGPDGIFGTADDVVQDADGILQVANNGLGVPLGNPLDVTQGPGGTLWVAEIGSNEITVLEPTVVLDPTSEDADFDGILNKDDPFSRDAANGTSVTVTAAAPTVWEFSQGAGDTTPGPDGFGGGLTGAMINGETDFEAFYLEEDPNGNPGDLRLDNVKFVTAALGGTTTIEQVSNGDPLGTTNDGEYLFHTGFILDQAVETFTVSWNIANPAAIVGGSDITGPEQQIGGYLGDGTQSNYLKIVAVQTADGPKIRLVLEEAVSLGGFPETFEDQVVQTLELDAAGLFDDQTLVTDSFIKLDLLIDLTAKTATPTATFQTTTGFVTIAGGASDVIDLAPGGVDSKVLTTFLGGAEIALGEQQGIAAGLFSSNTGSATDSFQAVFDSITVSATEAEVAPIAVDDDVTTQTNTAIQIPVATLLANDTDANSGEVLTVTAVGNAVNGTVALDNGVVTFTPDQDFQGDATFDYTVEDSAGLTDTGSVTVSVSDLTVLFRLNAAGGTIQALPNDPYGSDLDWLGLGTGSGTAPSGTQSGFAWSVSSTNTSTHDIADRDASVPDYVPQELFAAERWDPPAAPDMQWTFGSGDLPSGTYTVNIFAGNGFSGTSEPGQRVFDITVEDELAFENVDLSAQFGHQVGALLSYEVQVDDGTLNVELGRGPGSVENPTINGIEILQGALAQQLPTIDIVSGDVTVNEDAGTIQVSVLTSETVPVGPGLDFTYVVTGVTAAQGADYAPLGTGNSAGAVFTSAGANIAGGSSDFTIDIEILDDSAFENAESLTVEIVSVGPGYEIGNAFTTITIADNDAPQGAVLYRVNAGGPLVAATDGGPDWTADTGNIGAVGNSPFLVSTSTGTSTYNNGASSSYAGDVASALDAPAGTPLAVFDTERYDPTDDAQPLAYQFDLGADHGLQPGDSVEVRLYFAEIFSGIDAPGERVFDVSVDGVTPPAFDDIDAFAATGAGNVGVVRSYVATVDQDGLLDIVFAHGFENPAVKAIEIVSVDGEPSYEPPLDDLFGAAVEIADTGDAPSGPVTLAAGSNVMSATQEGEGDGLNGVRDRDYFTVEVPDGFQLTGVVLTDYDNANAAAPDGFLAFQQGGTVTVDPTTGQNVTDLQGAIIYGEGDQGQNLLSIMRDGFDDAATGNSLPAFPDTLLTGTWTFWLNQGAGPSTATLDFIVEPLPAPVVTLSVADAPTLVENGDVDPTTLAFPLTASDPAFAGVVTITYDQGAQTGLTQAVTFAAGQGTLSIDTPSDDTDDGPDTVSVTITAAEDGATVFEIDAAANSATGVVTEDDLAGTPDDIDGDGLANIVDSAFADPTNGLSTVLTPSTPIVLDFETSGTDPFAAGFTGVNVNPDATATTDATDPYGAFTSGGVVIEDGLLKVATSQGDSFNENNASVDDYGVMFDARGNDSFSVKATLITPSDFTDANFQGWGIQIGDGTQESYIKFTRAFGGQFQVRWDDNDAAQQELGTGSGGVPALTAAQVAAARYDLELLLTGDGQGAWTVEARAQAFDASDVQIGGDIALGQIALTGDILVAINAGQLYAGIYSTDFGNAPSFTAQWADFSVVSNDTPPANMPPTADPITPTPVAESAAVVEIDLLADANAADPDGGTPAILPGSVSAVDSADNPVAFTLDGTSLSIDPAQFAAALNAGDTETVTVSYTITDGQGGETPNTATLVVNGESGDVSALIEVLAGNTDINASTFGNTSFQITNTGDAPITQVVLDLASGVLPDIVFDPDGTAGDATAKGFTQDGSSDATGVTPTFGSPNEGGFYTLTLDFTDFQPGETLVFGLDTDPTSVKGQSAPGAGESGSVSGLEMVGAGVSVTFDGGTTLTSSLFEDGSNAGAVTIVAPDAPAAPTIELVGGTSPSTVASAAQTIRVTGTPGATVRLLQAEGAMFEPLDGPGFDVELFEANSFIGREPAFTGTLGANGELSIPVTLTDSDPDGGLNHFIAVVEGAEGQTSATSNTLVVELDASVTPPSGVYLANANGDYVFEAESAEDQVLGNWVFNTTADLPAGHEAPTQAPGAGPDDPSYVLATSNHLGNLGGEELVYSFTAAESGFIRVNLVAAFSGASSTDENDSYVGLFLDGQPVEPQQQNGQSLIGTPGNPASVSGAGFFKLFSSSGTELDFILANKTWDDNGQPVIWQITAGETYDFILKERSLGHKVDRIVLEFSETQQSGTLSNGAADTLQAMPLSPQTLPGATISGRAFADANDSATDDSEPGIEGLSVELLDDQQTVVATAVTGSDGGYAFDDLADGVYSVRFPTDAVGDPLVAPNAGDDTVDSDADQATGQSAPIAVVAGQVVDNVDAGYDREIELVGSAFLTINNNSNNVQISNFGNGSFVLSNTGQKDITSVVIDVTDAFYPDAVFDPFGVAGDTTGKEMTIAGGLGGVSGVEEPINGFYIGAGGVLGFEGVRLDFDQAVNGGFDPGESVAFSVDMDPNSIAGAVKSILDPGAQPSWDVGGISGAELIGSSFTVTFADGTTATGTLQGQTDASGDALQGGSEGLATQAPADLDVVLTVNGVAEGGAGAYTEGGPTVVVNGPAGATARVTMTKGVIQPFANNFPDTADPDEYHDQLDAQLAALAASDFPANNAAYFQTFDVVLTGEDQDISSLFNFTDVPGIDLSPRNEAQLPLGFVAGIIDPGNGGAPLGPVSSPIHVVFTEQPTADLSLEKTASDSSPDFGDQIVFTVTITNDGPSAAGNVEVADTLGNGFAFVQAEGSAGAYDDASGVWTIDTLAAGASETLTLTATVLEAVTAAPDEVLYRVNAGGAEVPAGDGGIPWSADTQASNSPFLVNAGSNSDFPTNGSPNTNVDASEVDAPAEVIGIERWDNDDGTNGDMTWAFDVAAGTEVQINLYLAELFTGLPDLDESGDPSGDRIFDVSVDGVVPAAFDDIDPYVLAGNQFLKGVVVSHTLTSDGTIDLVFSHVSENPAVKGIEIIELGGAGGPLDYANTVEIIAASTVDPDSSVGNGVIGEDDDASVTVTPVAGGLNEVTIAATDPDAAEGAPVDPAQFTVSLEKVAATDTVVTYTVSGAATPDVDYAALSGTVTIPQGQLSALIDVTPLEDLSVEDDETVTVTLQGATGDADIAIGAASEATATIVSDDAPNLVSIAAGSDAAEPTILGQFVVSLSAPAATDTVVSYSVTGAATPDADYTALTGTVTIPANGTSATIDVAALDDLDLEGNEDVTVTLDAVTAGDANVELGASPSATLLILDDELPPISGSATVAITPNGGLDASTFGGTEAYQIVNSGAPGDADIVAVSIDLSTAVLPDMVFDPVGSGGDATAQVFQPDAGEAAAVGLTPFANPAVDPFSQPRNGGFDVITLSFTDFNPGETFSFGVDIDPNSIQGVAGAGDAGAVSGYELIGSTVTITFDDGSQQVVAAGSLFQDGSLGGAVGLGEAVLSTSATLAAPTIALVGPAQDASPNLPGEQAYVPTGQAQQQVRVTGQAGATVTLLQMDARLYIASGDDPFEVAPDELPFYANEATAGKVLHTAQLDANGEALIDVTLLATPEGTGPDGGLNHFVAVLTDGPYQPGDPISRTSNTLVVTEAPAVELSMATVSDGAEGGAAAQFEVTLAEASTVDTVVAYSVAGTAAAGEDYEVLGGEVTIAAGQTSALIEAAIIDDALDDDAETIEITLTEVTASDGRAALGATTTASATIADDDDANTAPVFTSGDSFTFVEGLGGPVFTAAAEDAQDDPITLSLGGADAALFDFDAATGEVSFAATPAYADGGDNQFELELTASDDALSTVQVVTIDLLKDSDGDTVADIADNAILVANTDQRDTDGDDRGNVIDFDLDNDFDVDFSDFLDFASVYQSPQPIQSGSLADHADFDGDGDVDFSDFLNFAAGYQQPLGPSFVDDIA